MQVTSTLTIPFYTDVFEVNDKLSQSLVEEVILACASDTDTSTVVGVVGSATESDLKRLGRIIGNYEGIFGRYLSLSAEEKQDEICFLFLSEQGENTCQRCSTLHGQLFSAEKLASTQGIPPLHPNCQCKLVAMDKTAQIVYYWSNGALTAMLASALDDSTGNVYLLEHDFIGGGLDAFSLTPLPLPDEDTVLDGGTSPFWWERIRQWGTAFGSDAIAAWDAFYEAQRERGENIHGISSFCDWLAYGIVSGMIEGNLLRGQEMLDNPSVYTIANWLTMGIPDTLSGTFTPEEPFSFDHWMSSLATVSLLYGGYRIQQRVSAINTPEQLTAPTIASTTSSSSPWTNEDGSYNWPPNDGFEGEITVETLQSGTRIDRYGQPNGSFVAPEGTPITARSLFPGTANKEYNVYEVVSPVNVQSGTSAPWFGEQGGGTQYRFSAPISQLLEDGILRKVGN